MAGATKLDWQAAACSALGAGAQKLDTRICERPGTQQLARARREPALIHTSRMLPAFLTVAGVAGAAPFALMWVIGSDLGSETC